MIPDSGQNDQGIFVINVKINIDEKSQETLAYYSTTDKNEFQIY